MTEHKVFVEAMDGQNITPRTGKSACSGTTTALPIEGMMFMVLWDKDENTESPGVCIEVNGLDKLGSEYRFSDYAGRQFRVVEKE